jgi:hypothetical protein
MQERATLQLHPAGLLPRPVDFKRQAAQEFLAGETLHGLAKRREIKRGLHHVDSDNVAVK